MNGTQLIVIILLILGFVAFLVAAAGHAVGRINLIAAGLALWILATIIEVWPK